jgi:serine/threonine-protein kinase HipA
VLGRLIYVKESAREFSQFTSIEKWASDPEFFDISPDVTQQLGYQLRKPKNIVDYCFFLALADTEPDAWGRRVIAQAHAKERAHNSALTPAFIELGNLSWH